MIRRSNVLRGDRLLNRLIGYCAVSVLCSSFGRAGRTVPCRAPVVAGGRGAAFHNTSRGRTVRRRGGEGASVAGDRVVGTQTPCVTPARQASAVAGVNLTPISFSASESRAISAFAATSSGSAPPWRTPGRDDASASSAPTPTRSHTSAKARETASVESRLRHCPLSVPARSSRPLPYRAGSLADAA
jgi:hypothetical protein